MVEIESTCDSGLMWTLAFILHVDTLHACADMSRVLLLLLLSKSVFVSYSMYILQLRCAVDVCHQVCLQRTRV